MIYKVYYQKSQVTTPERENTKSLYMESNSKSEVIELLENKTNYNIEHLEELEGAKLAYEQKSSDYKLVKF